jgi:hypothetical protein
VRGRDHDVLCLETERVVGCELSGDLLDPAVVALLAVIPEVTLAVEHDEDEVIALAIAQRDGPDPEAERVVPRCDRIHRADPEAAHVDAVGVLGPRRTGRRQMVAHFGRIFHEPRE